MKNLQTKAVIDISQAVYKGTGVGRFTTQLAINLLKYSKKISWGFFFSALRQPLPEFANRISKKQLHRFYFPPTLLDLLWNKLHLFPAEKFVKEYNWWVASDWTEPPTLSMKKATIIHDLAFLRYPETVHKKIFQAQKNRLKWIIKESNLIITDSKTTANDLKTLIRKKRVKNLLKLTNIDIERVANIPIVTIYPGVEIKRPTKIEEKKTLNFYGIEPKKYFLTVGKLEPRKNLKRLITAFSKIKKKDIKLVIVGPKGWEKNLEKKENIIFTGLIPDWQLFSLYKNAIALVYPSLWEGFGYPIIEAGLLKTPVICSNIEIFKEITANTALFFNPKNTNSIKNALQKALEDKSMLNNLKEKLFKVTKRYNWKEYVKNLENNLIYCDDSRR